VKFYIHTTGCKANQWDSYMIFGRLCRLGFTLDSIRNSDIIVINACTVTDGAERDLRRFISHCRKVNRGARIILTGCHAQVYPDNNFGADLVLGQVEKFRIEEFLEDSGCYVEGIGDITMEKPVIDNLPPHRTRFFFKIQDGCDRFCTYCVVPFARGVPRSRPMRDITGVMRQLKERGVQEVVLTGIELASFRDPETGTGLKGLLQILEQEETPRRIRLSSIDPLFIDDDFIGMLAASKKIAKHLHIPLQSGSGKVLEHMGRRYGTWFIKDVVGRLTGRIKGIGIGMDVIVGFPSETEELFLETHRFLETLDIYYFHIFPFSARKGTVAASMDDALPEIEKRHRVSRLRDLDRQKRQRFYERLIGKTCLVIPEGKVYESAYMRGYTDNYVPVHILYDKTLENNLIRVRIEGMRGEMLVGERVDGTDEYQQ
jgi:threonylcarbamoyladenosine tRNA methylthiotransferase MtaB